MTQCPNKWRSKNPGKAERVTTHKRESVVIGSEAGLRTGALAERLQHISTVAEQRQANRLKLITETEAYMHTVVNVIGSRAARMFRKRQRSALHLLPSSASLFTSTELQFFTAGSRVPMKKRK